MILKPFKENQCSDKYFANIEKKIIDSLHE